MLRLTFPASPSILGAGRRADVTVEGRSPEELLDNLHARGEWSWIEDPFEFRNHLCWTFGADVDLPAMDEEILEALAPVFAQEGIRLEKVSTAADLVERAATNVPNARYHQL